MIASGGGSSSPLLDIKKWRQSRMLYHRATERAIHRL
ncbi:MAG: hypothetical protein QOH24_178 [Verrucomicrobiota bacterium]